MTPTVAVSAIPFGLSLFPLLSCLDCTIARNLSFRLEKKLKRAIVHSGETVSWGRDMRIITIEVPGSGDAKNRRKHTFARRDGRCDRKNVPYLFCIGLADTSRASGYFSWH